MVIVTVTIKAAFMDRDAYNGMEDDIAGDLTLLSEDAGAERAYSVQRECEAVDVPDVDEDEPLEAYTTWQDLAHQAMEATEASAPWDSTVRAHDWRAGHEPEARL